MRSGRRLRRRGRSAGTENWHGVTYVTGPKREGDVGSQTSRPLDAFSHPFSPGSSGAFSFGENAGLGPAPTPSRGPAASEAFPVRSIGRGRHHAPDGAFQRGTIFWTEQDRAYPVQ